MNSQTNNPFKPEHINYFFEIAKTVSTMSKDPSTKTGAVIVNTESKQIIACGYNGFPAGYDDSPENYLDKEFKYPRIVHAEMNAILSAAKHGISTNGATLFIIPIHVCNECAKAIIQAGIKHVYCKAYKDHPKWIEIGKISKDLFERCGVNYNIIE